MNLVQIQERLKDMPLQAVMQYANGMNPDVPPYLALGELNRRKKMEQAMQPAELPQGTVKEQLENEVGLAALQKQLMNQLQTQGLRQRQAAMSQGQQMARMPGPVPQGVPQPEVSEEVEMAEGGVATLRVPDNQFEFGSGGIIAFKNGGINPEFVTDPYEGQEVEPSDRQKRRAAIDEAERLRREEIRERAERQKRAEEQAARVEFLERSGVPADMAKPVQEGRVLTTNPITPDRNFPDNRGTAQRFPPGPPPAPAVPGPARQPAGIATVAPPMAAPPVAPQGVAYPQAGPMQQALAAMATGPQTPYPSYEQMRKEAEAKDEYLKKRPGEKLEQYLATLERRDREDQERFQEMEKERTRGALWKSLMAAGEASRGQRGIGALLGGFGKTSETEMEAARGREEKQRALMREREMNRVKMAQEIESARIAASEGRFKDQREHEQKAAQYNQENKKIDVQLATTQAGIEAAQQGRQYESASAMAREQLRIDAEARERKLDRQSRESIANLPTGEERLASAFINNYMKENPGKKYHEAYAAYKQSGQSGMPAERQQLAELKALQTSLNKQLETTFKAEDRKKVQDQLNQVNEAIGRMAGIGAAQDTPQDIKDILKRYSR
jgi:hypothetical protein